MKSKGELETEVSNAVIRFKREYMGRGPKEVRTFLVEDMALVRLRGVLRRLNSGSPRSRTRIAGATSSSNCGSN